MDIVSGLAAANSALAALKAVRDIERGVDEAKFKMALADAYQNLADVKIALSEAADENLGLNNEIEMLKKNWAFSEELVGHHGYKYRKGSDGKPYGEAFCNVCEINEGKYFQLSPSKGMIVHTCPNCKTDFHQISSFLWQDEV